ncbi:glutathione S-transferase omega-1 [Galendromus occidentalis]|uniref:Glutathione S-transferase omega-1 n=1 Tax=Galendromus occidentalis TaxID=34638 RepID=A0AAJ6VZI2_9ACAR|nr:glutathione S-transferase omega-1 [Galendromus occidentalis]
MSLKALGSGASEPEAKTGVIRLYCHRFCPFSHRAVLVAFHKNIPVEICNINVKDKPDWYLKKSPSGKVPLLEKDGRVLSESLVIAEYLDSVSDGAPLIPRDPFDKALDQMFLESLSLFPILKIHFENERRAEFFEDFIVKVKPLVDELTKRGRKFLAGDEQPGFVDYMIWPFFHHYLALREIYPELQLPRTAVLDSWIASMQQEPAVKELVDVKIYAEFLKLYMEAKYDFDLGL